MQHRVYNIEHHRILFIGIGKSVLLCYLFEILKLYPTNP